MPHFAREQPQVPLQQGSAGRTGQRSFFLDMLYKWCALPARRNLRLQCPRPKKSVWPGWNMAMPISRQIELDGSEHFSAAPPVSKHEVTRSDRRCHPEKPPLESQNWSTLPFSRQIICDCLRIPGGSCRWSNGPLTSHEFASKYRITYHLK